jgi:four helix bundle protein
MIKYSSKGKFLVFMNSFEDLEIYQMAFDLALQLHKATLKLPRFELHEQGGQSRRSSKGIKDTIAEGFGRRRYKPEFIRYLTFAHASCDEVRSQLKMMIILYPEIEEFPGLLDSYGILGKKINKFIQYVENNWRT